MRLATRNPSTVPSNYGTDFDAFVNRVFGHDLGVGGYRYPVDVFESEDTLTLVMDLPGYAKEQVDVTIDNDVLTIIAERPEASAGDDKTVWHLRERRAGRVERAFRLPNTIDAGSIDAKLADGILSVSLKKRQEAKPRKITIA